MKVKITEDENNIQIWLDDTLLDLNCVTEYSIKRYDGKKGIQLALLFEVQDVEFQMKIDNTKKKKDY